MQTRLSLCDVLAAADRLRGAVHLTCCHESSALSRLTGIRVLLKREDLQRTGSFKERGARNALSVLPFGGGARSVVAASAGNHALGLAYHGGQLGVHLQVVMPLTAPAVKIEKCRQLGAEVSLHGETFEEARVYAMNFARETGQPFVHPFDDVAVMAGQGTIALEVLEQVPDVDAVVVPVGGGGLLAGVGVALRALKPGVTIIGVEPESAPCFTAALAAGAPVSVNTFPTLADGLAVSKVGELTFSIAADFVDQMVTVSEAEIAMGMRELGIAEDAMIEGAGATALAALFSDSLASLRGKTVVALVSGRNVDAAVHHAATH